MPTQMSSKQDVTKVTTDAIGDGIALMENMFSAAQGYYAGMSRYTTDFFIPYFLSSQYFQRVEEKRVVESSPAQNFDAYIKLLQTNIDLMERSTQGVFNMMMAYAQLEMDGFINALEESCFELKHEKLIQFTKRQAELLQMVSHTYPDNIEAIQPEFGFHFESGKHELFDETDRFLLYRVTPSTPQTQIRLNAKPVLIIPPFVLGTNILGFLPDEQRSYAHSFANQGFPTYIRVLKDIQSSPALQVMTGEDDALDTRRFCQAIMKEHGKRITMNGYCQGGFSALCNLLSGQLDDLVDAFITCVSPIDGTRSTGLARFLNDLPDRFNDLAYGTKVLANGNKVADGKIMGWVYKLKSIEHEIPAAAFFRDLTMFAQQQKDEIKVSKSAAALNYWLRHERSDLPLAITHMSFASYTTPITKDGTLPVRLFDKKLNLKRLQDKNIPWLICYGVDDDLVEKETALAPQDYIDVEVTPFPKGHVAIATSWSSPNSDCALHTRFGKENYRGPVRFHMDLDADLEAAADDAVPTSQPTTEPEVEAKSRNTKPAPAKKASPVKKPASKGTSGTRVVKKTAAASKKTPTTTKSSTTSRATTADTTKQVAKAKTSTPAQTKQAGTAKTAKTTMKTTAANKPRNKR